MGVERYVISASTEWLVEGAAPLLGFPIDAAHIFGIRVRLDAGDRLSIDDADAYPTTYRQKARPRLSVVSSPAHQCW